MRRPSDPQSIMAMGLRFMTSKVMERVPVADWKTEWGPHN